MTRWTPKQAAQWIAGAGSTAGGELVRALRSTGPAPIVLEYLQQLDLAGLPAPELEFRFHPVRQWRADFAWPAHMILAEYEGGTWTGGSHTRGRRYESDCVKYNTATLAGWRVLRFTHDLVKNGTALAQTEQALAGAP